MVPPDTEFVSHWDFAREVQTGQVLQTSYDFERPSTNLLVKATRQREHDQSEHDAFDFQGDYTQKADGQQLDRRPHRRTADRLRRAAAAKSNAHGVEVGRTLKLTRHPRDDQNREYLITAIGVRAQVDGAEAGITNPGEFECQFGAIPHEQQFRPPRAIRKPIVQGPQTAVVVGPAGEEIFTDKYGRVKVQFHWDRYGRQRTRRAAAGCG